MSRFEGREGGKEGGRGYVRGCVSESIREKKAGGRGCVSVCVKEGEEKRALKRAFEEYVECVNVCRSVHERVCDGV